MIVAGPDGLMKNQYRKFTIRGERAAEPADEELGAFGGDDYAMMREVLHRRFARALKEDPDRASGSWPDLVLIDGGLGQLGAAQGVLDELAIDDVPLVGIAKGPDRNAGRERFFIPGRTPFSLEPRDPVLYFAAAAARRGASLRHRHAPGAADQGARPVAARRDRRDRRPPQAGLAPSFRFGAQRRPRRARRDRAGRRYQQSCCAKGL